MENTIVEIDQLTFSRGERLIFDNITMRIPRGKVTAIMGPSGTGKTTLLRLIGGQLQPAKGEIRVNQQCVHRLSRRDLYALRKQMGMLFQTGGLFTHLSVLENVAFALREHTHLTEDMIRDLALIKLELVGLRGTQDLMPSELSGGMARRVALARAIAMDPQLIMYDEPFTGQDPISLGVLVKLIRKLNDALGLSSIIVSHDVQETLSIADYVYVIAAGKVIGEGTPEALQAQTSAELKQFLQGLPDGPVAFHYPAKPYLSDLLGVVIHA